MDQKINKTQTSSNNSQKESEIHGTSGGEMPDVSRSSQAPKKQEVEEALKQKPQNK